ncbi:hypothetical protein KSI01_13980 [Kurthia sibirica]|nr:hypothetical protein KSI01_13980 [Kurthia sibirica]
MLGLAPLGWTKQKASAKNAGIAPYYSLEVYFLWFSTISSIKKSLTKSPRIG